MKHVLPKGAEMLRLKYAIMVHPPTLTFSQAAWEPVAAHLRQKGSQHRVAQSSLHHFCEHRTVTSLKSDQ